MNAQVCCCLENIAASIEDACCKLSGQGKPCVVSGDGCIDHAHLAKCCIDLFQIHFRQNGIRDPSEAAESRAVIAQLKCIGSDLWYLPVLKIAEIVLNGELFRIQAHDQILTTYFCSLPPISWPASSRLSTM